MSWIDKLVRQSPIEPMQKHMHVAVLCAREILPLIDAMTTMPFVNDGARLTDSNTKRMRLNTRFEATCHDD